MAGDRKSGLSASERAVLAGVADLLIPRYETMPAASEVGVQEQLIDDVLACRPDVIEAFRRGLEKCRGKDPSEAANALSQDDAEAFGALSLAISAAYYMADEVRERIGYPGQERAEYDPFETPDYLTNGMIERVVRRGPVYKPTPR